MDRKELNSPQYNYDLLKHVGLDVFISANVEIRRPHLVNIGDHVAIDSGFYCTTQALVGSYVHISPYVTVIGGAQGLLEMENFSGIGAGSRIICVSEELLGEGLIGPTIPEKYQDRKINGPVKFKQFSSVSTNVVVCPGVTIGEGTVVAACSLVTSDLEPWTIYGGIPARPIKRRPKEKMIEYAKKLGFYEETAK